MFETSQRFFQGMSHIGESGFKANLGHRLLELLAVLCFINGLLRSTDHLDPELFKHTVSIKIEGAIKCGLPPHGGQKGIRPFLLDDAGNGLPVNRFNIGGIGHLRIRHDGCRIRVH